MWTPTIWLFTVTATALGPAPEAAPAPRAPAVAQAPAKEAPAKEAPALDPALQKTVDELQRTYEGTKDFEAKFTQRFTYTLLRRTQESRGTVRFKKPGLMRWDYLEPSKKAFIVDGKSLWIYQSEDKTAMVNRCFKQDGLTASVSFLWGAGKISEQFHVAHFDGVFGAPTDIHLELTPRQANNVFAKLILVVDPASHRVKQSIVVDVQGNVNQFIYEDAVFNKGAKDGAFAFAPPKGTHVSKMPGSCEAGDATAKGG